MLWFRINRKKLFGIRCDQTPVELYLSCQLKTKLDLLKPLEKLSKEKTRGLLTQRGRQTRVYINNRNKRKFDISTNKFGNLHYMVRLNSGYIFKRHINQIYKCNVLKPIQHLSNTTKPITPQEHFQPSSRHFLDYYHSSVLCSFLSGSSSPFFLPLFCWLQYNFQGLNL